MKISPQISAIAFGISLAAGVVYLVRTFLGGAKEKIDDAVYNAAGPLAEAIAGPKVSVADGFQLPGGRRVTFDQLIASGGKLASDQTLVWQGVKYRLTHRQADGWYAAERA